VGSGLPPSRPFAGARGGARVRAAAGIEATTARASSGQRVGARSARGQTVTCLAMDLQHRRGGDPGTREYVGATLPSRAHVLRPAFEHETRRTGVLVGARGFEPPTSSSRTMRATKLRHAPTEVLVAQSHGIVARGDPPRHRPTRDEISRRLVGARVHHPGRRRNPEVPGNRDPPLRRSHFAPGALPVGSDSAPNGDPRVAREGRTPIALRPRRRARETIS
jgi:hypothetical protein